MMTNKKTAIVMAVIVTLFLIVAIIVYNLNLEKYLNDQETYGYFDCILFDIPEKNVNFLNNFFVKKYGLFYTNIVSINNAHNQIIVSFADDKSKEMLPIVLSNGKEPSNKGEIAISEALAEEFSYSVGDQIILNGNEYTVSGIFIDRVTQWRQNPYGTRDKKLNMMPDALVSKDDLAIKENVINAVMMMRKIKEYDSAKNTIYTLGHSLFDGEAEYDDHIYYSELYSQGFEKYNSYSSFLTLFAISSVLCIVAFLARLFYQNKNNDDKSYIKTNGYIGQIIIGLCIGTILAIVFSYVVLEYLTISIGAFLLDVILIFGVSVLSMVALSLIFKKRQQLKDREIQVYIILALIVAMLICIIGISMIIRIFQPDTLKSSSFIVIIVANVILMLVCSLQMIQSRKFRANIE